MHKDVVAVPPETTLEEAVAIAQTRKIGSLVISENDRVIGIATTNDIFMAILNPLLGIGMTGSRIVVINCFSGPDIERVIGVINNLKVAITNLFVSEFPIAKKHDLFIHLAAEDASEVARAIEKLGFSVVIRKR
jgi:acetoin utilization protein AcuB